MKGSGLALSALALLVPALALGGPLRPPIERTFPHATPQEVLGAVAFAAVHDSADVAFRFVLEDVTPFTVTVGKVFSRGFPRGAAAVLFVATALPRGGDSTWAIMSAKDAARGNPDLDDRGIDDDARATAERLLAETAAQLAR